MYTTFHTLNQTTIDNNNTQCQNTTSSWARIEATVHILNNTHSNKHNILTDMIHLKCDMQINAYYLQHQLQHQQSDEMRML